MTMQLESPWATHGDRCPIDGALQALGNRAALLMVREAFYGTTRFDQFCDRAGLTSAVAAQRLRELVTVGVLEKQPYREPGQRSRHEYVLTTAGHELLPVILGLLQWGAAHAPGGGGAVMTHDGCGTEVRAVVRCGAGHDVDESEIIVPSRGQRRKMTGYRSVSFPVEAR
jgi:DNA-binding HxlR family transcriptional regulator